MFDRNISRTEVIAKGRANWRILQATIVFSILSAFAVMEAIEPGITLSTDSAMFLYGGEQIRQGTTPYVDFWDVKPPLVYVFTLFLAVIAQGDMVVMFSLSVAATILAMGGSMVLIGELLYETTGDEVASLIGGLTPLIFPPVYYWPPHGLKVKALVMVFGFAAILLAMRSYPLLAGISAAVSAGLWQFGLIFVVVMLLIVFRRGRQLDVQLAILGGTVITVAVLGWLAWIGALEAAITEVVLAPFIASETSSILDRLTRMAFITGWTLPCVCLAFAGYTRSEVNWRQREWAVLFATLFAAQIIFIDFDGFNDLLVPIAAVGIGVGLFVGKQSLRRQTLVAAIVVSAVVAGPIWIMHPSSPLHDATASSAEAPETQIEDYYWEQRPVDRCHLRLSETELQWLESTGRDISAKTCGDFPDTVTFI